MSPKGYGHGRPWQAMAPHPVIDPGAGPGLARAQLARPGPGPVSLECMGTCIRNARDRCALTCMTKIDISGAFDNIRHPALEQAMLDGNVPLLLQDASSLKRASTDGVNWRIIVLARPPVLVR